MPPGSISVSRPPEPLFGLCPVLVQFLHAVKWAWYSQYVYIDYVFCKKKIKKKLKKKGGGGRGRERIRGKGT